MVKSNSRDRIEGHDVVDRTRARMPAANGSGGMVEVSTVDEVLLDDGAVLYQCAYPDAGCDWASSRVKSVVAHQRAHSPKIAIRRQNQAAAERLEAQRVSQRRGVEAQARRRDEITSRGVAQTIRDVAETLTEVGKTLRLAAQLIGASDEVTSDELARLRADAAELAKLRAILK